LADKQKVGEVDKYLDEYYGFPPGLEKELRQHKSTLVAEDVAELDQYVAQCLATREEPDFDRLARERSPEPGKLQRSAMKDPRTRYVLCQLIKLLTAERLSAIAAAARPDKSVDVDKLAKALTAKEKGKAGGTAKELRSLLGSQPTVDVAARVLVGLDIKPSGQQEAGTRGYWSYVCRNRCCLFKWACSWGCLLIACWAD